MTCSGRPPCAHSRGRPFVYCLPDVLDRMPRSCRLVFAAFIALADAEGHLRMPLREIARLAGLSETQLRRALRRLIGAKLIRIVCSGRGSRPTIYRLCWEFRSFPQPRAPLSPTPSFQRNRKKAPAETYRGLRPRRSEGRLTSRALRWAMAQLRRYIGTWGLAPPRRETLLQAFGVALWRAIRLQLVRTRQHLRRLLLEIKSRLRTAPAGVSADPHWAHCYAGGVTRDALVAIR